MLPKFKINLSDRSPDPACPIVEISFTDGRPDAQIRTTLKGRCFRWAPSKSVWYGPALTLVGTPFEKDASRFLAKRVSKKTTTKKATTVKSTEGQE